MSKVFKLICFMCICKITKEQDITFLESKLLHNYSSIIKPRRNQREPVFINISFTIYSVRDVNEKHQFLTFFGFFDISWYDDFLKWNKSDYLDVEYVNIPNTKVWTPDLGLYSSFANLFDLGFTPFVTVYSDGFVKWYPGDEYSVDCEINIQKFPFDEQKCAIIVSAWQTTDWMQTLVPNAKNISIDTIAKNGEWQFLRLSIASEFWVEYNMTAVRYVLHMKRRWFYYLLNIVIPIMVLALLNTFTFLLPCSSGDRIQYSVTLFVAFSVFLTLFQQITPTSSIDMPYFTIYTTFHLLSSSVSVITSVTSCIKILKGIPSKIKSAITKFGGCCRKSVYKESKIEHNVDKVPKGSLSRGSFTEGNVDHIPNSDSGKIKGSCHADVDANRKTEIVEISPFPFAISFLCLCASTFAFYLGIYI